MSRYDGLIIPRSYSEYLNKTDSATLSQMLQHLTGLWSHAVSAGDNKPVTSDAVYEALTDAATIQQALQVPGVLSEAVAAGDNKPVTSDAVYEALTDAATIQQALQVPGVLSGAVAAGDNKAVKSDAVATALANNCINIINHTVNYSDNTIHYDCNDYLNKNIEIFANVEQFDNLPAFANKALIAWFVSRGENLEHNDAARNYRNIQEVRITKLLTNNGWQTKCFRRFAIDTTIFDWVEI